jgi:AcrR family transcriptional regulator
METNVHQNKIDAKNKIFEASAELMKHSAYDNLSVRNICRAAGISSGTFYYYFKNKDDLMTYVITEGYTKYKALHSNDSSDPPNKVFNILVFFAEYFSNLGLVYMTNFLSAKNQALNVDHILESVEHRQLVNDLIDGIKQSQQLGMISHDFNAREIYDELNIIFYGALFYWCLSSAKYNLSKSIRKMLADCMNQYLYPEYKIMD